MDQNAENTAHQGQHLAAILPSMGADLEVQYRPTPTPGPGELLIEVRSIALNPIDVYQHAMGIFIAGYPAVLGSDVAGIVVSAGSSVPADAPKPGTRVAAFAPCFYQQGNPNYGAFQTRVLVPAENAVELPQKISFNEGSLLPMSTGTAWAAWYTIGVKRDTSYTPADKKGMLIWGGASSVGSAAVQIASKMGFSVYVTASEKHHGYMKTLGATRVFDYKNESVVENIVKAVKDDGVTIQSGFDAVGQLKYSLEVLSQTKSDGIAKLASATPLSAESPKMEGVEVKFTAPPADEQERKESFHFIFGVFLKEKLVTGDFVPSPKIQVVEGGLKSVQKGLEILRGGVSGTKLVLEI